MPTFFYGLIKKNHSIYYYLYSFNEVDRHSGDKWNLTYYEVPTVYNFFFIKGPYIISGGSRIKYILIAVLKSYHQLPLLMTNTILC